MKRKNRFLRIRWSFVLYCVCIAVFSSVSSCFSSVLALGVHECAHVMTAKILGEQLNGVELTPFGGVISYDKTPQKGLRGLLVALSGPLANYIALAVVPGIPSHLLSYSLKRSLIIANAMMLGLNIMPALPLDGGQALFALGYYVIKTDRLIRMLTCLGGVLGLSFIGVGIYGIFRLKMLNLSVWMIGLYLIVYARKISEQMMAENLYAIIRERIENKTRLGPVTVYRIEEEMLLLDAMNMLSQAKAALFQVENSTSLQFIDEKTLCRAFLKNPNTSVRTAIRNE